MGLGMNSGNVNVSAKGVRDMGDFFAIIELLHSKKGTAEKAYGLAEDLETLEKKVKEASDLESKNSKAEAGLDAKLKAIEKDKAKALVEQEKAAGMMKQATGDAAKASALLKKADRATKLMVQERKAFDAEVTKTRNAINSELVKAKDKTSKAEEKEGYYNNQIDAIGRIAQG